MAANTDIRLHAKNAAIYVNGPKGTGSKAAAKAEVTLNLNRDYVDVTSFGDTNKHWLTGLRDVSGTWSGNLDVSGDLMINLTDDDDVPLYIYADDRTSHEILVAFGKAFVDGSISLSNTDAAKTSGNFRASNNWAIFSDGTLTP